MTDKNIFKPNNIAKYDSFAGSKSRILEEDFKKNTAGLVSAKEFKWRKDNLDKGILSGTL